MSKFLFPAAALLALVGSALTWSRLGADEGTVETAGASSPGAARVKLESIGALELGPGGVLFVADSVAAKVYALEMDFAKPETSKDGDPTFGVQNLDEKIAALLGIGIRDVVVEDMAVHEESGTALLSVMRGRGDDALPVLLQVSRDGKISEVALDKVRHSHLTLSDAPDKDAKLYRWESHTFTVTDLEWVDGELFIAGLSNEEFASVLRRAPYPFEKDFESTGLEIYHGAHGIYETFAPIFSFIPYEIAGKKHILASYLCTPLVTFPLEEVRSKERLRGKTIAELGWGNLPRDLVPFRKDGEDWVLIINSSRGTMKVKAADIAAAQKRAGITEEVGPRVGVEDHTSPVGTVAQAARLGDRHVALLLRGLDDGALHLTARSMARL